jgi:hypothetical protein
MGAVYYDIDAFFYKEYREFHCRFKNEEWWMLSTKQIIYYTHWANAIMYDFLNSEEDILNVAKNIKIKSIYDYFSSKSLF